MDLRVRISGSGEVLVDEGRVSDFQGKVSGSGDLEMSEVRTDRASLRISGSGSGMIWAEKSLEARVSGSGEVGFRGQPEDVNTSVSGSGNVHSLSGLTED